MACSSQLGPGDWAGIWARGVKAGERWDIGQAEPDLVYELQHGTYFQNKNRALVPGCGRGYQAMAAAEAGYAQVLAVDLIPAAVETAKEVCAAYKTQIDFAMGDFFTMDLGEKFDLVLDSTFLCAIPQDLRMGGAWADRMEQVLQVGGILLMQVFPIAVEEADTEGPPFMLTPDLVRGLLKGRQFKEVLCRDSPPERANRTNTPVRGKAVREVVMVWERI